MLTTNLGFGQISFNSVTLETGHRGYIATAIADMNNDYLDDIIKVSYYGKISIAYQQRNGTFNTELKDSVEYESINFGSWSICVADVNADSYNDFFIGNHDNQFVFTSSSSNNYTRTLLDSTYFAQGANFVDIDHDGDLDLFVCNDDSSNYVYANDGNGNFTIDTSLINTLPSSGNYSSVWSDYDNDSDLDLYVSKCKHGVSDSTDLRRINLFYQNDGNGNYTDVADTLDLDDGSQSWSSDFGDIDNDGDLDLIVANHEAYHRLYENNGDGTFTQITSQSGIDQYTDAGVFQSLFSDLDNDGWLDLILANQDNQKVIYQNQGDGTFTIVPNPLDSNKLYSISLGDLNFDGFVDMYSIRDVPPPNEVDDEIHYNNGNSNHYLGFTIEEASAKNSIGTKLKMYGPWGVQLREIRSGESYGIHNSFEKIFGMGMETVFDSLVVVTLDGIKCVYTSIPQIDTKYLIEMPSCTMTEVLDTTKSINSKLSNYSIYTEGKSIIIESKAENLNNKEIVLYGLKGNKIQFEMNKSTHQITLNPRTNSSLVLLKLDNELVKITLP